MKPCLSETLTILEDRVASGQTVGAQLYVSLAGEVVADVSFGEASPGIPMAVDTLLPWSCAIKPLIAVCFARLWEEGLIGLDVPVASVLPEFQQGGKGAITVRHILTHTGGFKDIPDAVPALCDWKTVLDMICRHPLDRGWIPGWTAGYHMNSGWFILAEVCQRVGGGSIEEQAETLFRLSGMTDSHLALTPKMRSVYVSTSRLGLPYKVMRLGLEPIPALVTEEYCARPNPAAGGYGTARDLGRFYEALLGYNREALLHPPTLEAMTAVHRFTAYDQTLEDDVAMGLGFFRDLAKLNYSERCSPRAFGHHGALGTWAFADPEFGLVVGLRLNGVPKDHHRVRTYNPEGNPTITAVYLDLRLIPSAARS